MATKPQKYLSQNKQTATTPIVFVTAILNEHENIIKGYDVGAIDYLTKPIDPDILLAKTNIFIKLYMQQLELEALVKKLDQYASFDSLTGLMNRHQFNEDYKKLVGLYDRYKRQFGVLLLDLDGFKAVNDHHGHDVGDLLLQVVSDRLKKELRASDSIARLGGDEFAILLTDLKSVDDPGRIADGILKVFAEPFDIQGHELAISTSIGIAVYPDAVSSKRDLIKAADVALYRAKGKGKNRFEYYSEKINKAFKRRSRIESSLEEAIKDEAFTLLFQPRMTLSDMTVSSLEALARWEHPKEGEIEPIEFIQMAEEMGVMAELGELLIGLAFKQFAVWQKAYKEICLSLSINLSSYQMNGDAFISRLRKMASEYDIDLSRVVFELPESIFKESAQGIGPLMQQIEKLKISFALDDFGLGYASLSRLKKLPISILKIDRVFVEKIGKSKDDDQIVKAIIHLAKTLGLEVVAEGVETEDQAKFLVEHNCPHAQGYYYAKPLSAKDVDPFLKDAMSK